MQKLFRPVAALFALTFMSSLCLAQGNATVPIVVVDLSQVFEKHPTFNTRMNAIKQEVKTTEAAFQAQGKQIEASVKQLQSMSSSDPNYRQLESDTARRQAAIQAEMQLKRKDFLEKEARVYYETYEQVKSEIKVFAESNRIGLVLRFSSEKIDPTNRQSVLQGVNQPILYNQGGLDITNYIVTRLVRAAGTQQASRTASPGAQQPPRR